MFPSNYRFHSFKQSHIRILHLKRGFNWKYILSWSLHQNTAIPKITESAINDSSRSSNSRFFVTAGLINLIKVPIEPFTLVEEDSFTTTIQFDPWITILIVRKFQRVHHYCLISIFELMFLGIYRFDDFQQGLNRTIRTCRGGFDWKTSLWLLHQNASDPKNPKALLIDSSP